MGAAENLSETAQHAWAAMPSLPVTVQVGTSDASDSQKADCHSEGDRERSGHAKASVVGRTGSGNDGWRRVAGTPPERDDLEDGDGRGPSDQERLKPSGEGAHERDQAEVRPHRHGSSDIAVSRPVQKRRSGLPSRARSVTTTAPLWPAGGPGHRLLDRSPRSGSGRRSNGCCRPRGKRRRALATRMAARWPATKRSSRPPSAARIAHRP